MLDGSRSVFGPEPFDDALAARLAAFDIHPTGPLWGAGRAAHDRRRARVGRQRRSTTTQSLAVRAGLEAAGLKQERRALRLRPQAMAWEWPAHDVLRLRSNCRRGVMRRRCSSWARSTDARALPPRALRSSTPEKISVRRQQHQHRARAALVRRRRSERQHLRAMPQHPVDQVLQRRRLAVAVQALAVDRPSRTRGRAAARAPGTRATSPRRASHRSNAGRVRPAPRIPRAANAATCAAAPIPGDTPAHRPLPAHRRTSRAGTRSAASRLVARGHARRGAGPRLRRRRGLRRQLAHRADRVAEQRGVVDRFRRRRRDAVCVPCRKPSASHRL